MAAGGAAVAALGDEVTVDAGAGVDAVTVAEAGAETGVGVGAAADSDANALDAFVADSSACNPAITCVSAASVLLSR